MKPLVILAALLLTSCATTASPATYADSIYRVARSAAIEAVALGHLRADKFDELDAKAQAILFAIHAGNATVDQLLAITREMKAARHPSASQAP